ARESVEKGGRDGRTAHLHLAGRDRRENLGRGLEAHELDVEPLVFEVTLLLSDEDAGIGNRADGADLDRHARIERRGLRRGGRAGDRQRGREEAHDERRSDGPKRHDSSPWGVLQLRARQAWSCLIVAVLPRCGAGYGWLAVTVAVAAGSATLRS